MNLHVDRRRVGFVVGTIAFMVLAVIVLFAIRTLNTDPGSVAVAQEVPDVVVVDNIPTPTDAEWDGNSRGLRSSDSPRWRVVQTIVDKGVENDPSTAPRSVAPTPTPSTAAWTEYMTARASGREAAYLDQLDRVVYAPAGIKTLDAIADTDVMARMDGPQFNSFECNPGDRCAVPPLDWFYHEDDDGWVGVAVDATGHVYQADRPHLPTGYEFLSEFPHQCISVRAVDNKFCDGSYDLDEANEHGFDNLTPRPTFTPSPTSTPTPTPTSN